MNKTQYTVNAWGSYPNKNDDCWYGKDSVSENQLPTVIKDFKADQGVAYIEVVGKEIIKNPNFKASVLKCKMQWLLVVKAGTLLKGHK